MKTKKVSAEHLWKQVEDDLTPRLRLSPIERAVYLHLLRHSHLEGKRRVHFSLIWLGRNLCLSKTPVRNAVHRLDELRALRIVERSKAGHVAEIRPPEEIAPTRACKAQPSRPSCRRALASKRRISQRLYRSAGPSTCARAAGAFTASA